MRPHKCIVSDELVRQLIADKNNVIKRAAIALRPDEGIGDEQGPGPITYLARLGVDKKRFGLTSFTMNFYYFMSRIMATIEAAPVWYDLHYGDALTKDLITSWANNPEVCKWLSPKEFYQLCCLVVDRKLPPAKFDPHLHF